MRMSLCIVLVAIMVEGAARADERRSLKLPDPAGPPFASYAEECGFEIRRQPTAHVSRAEIGSDGVARIIMDPSLDLPMQRFHRIFLIAHECAHHRMNHTTREGISIRQTRRHGVRDQEMSADCWAAEILTREGHLSQLLRLADEFWRRGFVSPGQGYPSGIQRSNVIRHCAQLTVRRMKEAYRLAGASISPRDFHP